MRDVRPAIIEIAEETLGSPSTVDGDGDEVELQEQTERAFAEARVDRSTGIVSNVSLHGAQSRNGRFYSDDAMRDVVEELRGGTPWYMDHAMGSDRSVSELAGTIKNPRLAEGGSRVKGDLVVFDRQPSRSIVFGIAEHGQDLGVGFSISAKGKVSRGQGHGGNNLVEKVTAVKSVDLVTDPATVGGLMEQIEEEVNMEKDIEEVDLAAVEQLLFRGRPYGGRATLGVGDDREMQESEEDGPDLRQVADRLFV